ADRQGLPVHGPVQVPPPGDGQRPRGRLGRRDTGPGRVPVIGGPVGRAQRRGGTAGRRDRGRPAGRRGRPRITCGGRGAAPGQQGQGEHHGRGEHGGGA